ncbi:MAG: hypothetical protein WC552_02955 [Candidatus Omnitrophota bacterium]
MIKKATFLIGLILFLLINSGCALLKVAIGAGIGYAISRAINGGW